MYRPFFNTVQSFFLQLVAESEELVMAVDTLAIKSWT